MAQVVETGTEGPLVGNPNDLRAAAERVADQLGQRPDLDRRVAAHVVDAAGAAGVGQQRRHGPHDVAHVAEAARLAPVAVDLQGLARQGRGHEAGKDHAVVAHLPRPHDVEEPHDDDLEVVFLVMSQGQELVDRLRARVGPPRLRGRPVDDVVALGERQAGRLAVDLGGGGDQDRHRAGRGKRERRRGLEHVRLDGADGLPDHQAHADRRRQVVDLVELGRVQPGQRLGDGPLENRHPGTRRAGEIAAPPGGQVVDDDHAVAPGHQVLHEV